MSFQATHLQFANQVKDTLNIKDLSRYFSGTLYPDSRYITKVKRPKTHQDVRIKPVKIFALTDNFIKGWQVHLWYDKLALPRLYNIITGKKYQHGGMDNHDIWIPVTAAKLVEDLYWWEKTDWQQILPYLKFINNPNQENPEILKKWYQHFIEYFQNPPNLDDYQKQAKFMGIDPDIIKAININSHVLNNELDKKNKLHNVMAEVMAEFKKLLK